MSENTGLSPFLCGSGGLFGWMIVPAWSRARCGFFLIGLWLFFSWPLLGFGCGLVAEFYVFQWDFILRFLFGCF